MKEDSELEAEIIEEVMTQDEDIREEFRIEGAQEGEILEVKEDIENIKK